MNESVKMKVLIKFLPPASNEARKQGCRCELINMKRGDEYDFSVCPVHNRKMLNNNPYRYFWEK
jgi:hypothetical protein